jgi:hypothetical protein
MISRDKEHEWSVVGYMSKAHLNQRKGHQLMRWLFGVFLFMAFVLIGCNSDGETLQPLQVQTISLPVVISPTVTLLPTSLPTFTTTPTIHLPTETFIPSIALTATPVLPATLEPTKAVETIKELLGKTDDCATPCFLGIMPGKTTEEETSNLFRHLGVFVARPNSGAYSTYYKLQLDQGPSLSITLTSYNDLVRNIQVDITPEKKKAGVAREWLAYSPEILIRRYGKPSRVEFFLTLLDTGSFDIVMYFDQQNLIVDYMGLDIHSRTPRTWEICPVTAQINDVGLWMGKNPYNPPNEGIPLEKAASMSIDEFSTIITGNPDQACLSLKIGQ